MATTHQVASVAVSDFPGVEIDKAEEEGQGEVGIGRKDLEKNGGFSGFVPQVVHAEISRDRLTFEEMIGRIFGLVDRSFGPAVGCSVSRVAV